MNIETVTYSQKHHVNMGTYEWVELAASVTVAPDDPSETTTHLIEAARAAVTRQLAVDLERAIVTTGEEETYVETWVDGPKRRKVTRRTTR